MDEPSAEALLASVERDLDSALKGLRAAHARMSASAKDEGSRTLTSAATQGALQIEDALHLIRTLRRKLPPVR